MRAFVDQVLRANIDLAAQHCNVPIARAQLLAARFSLNPVLSLSTGRDLTHEDQPANFGFVSRYVEGGFNFSGLLPNRHDDVFGVGATHSGISGVASRLSSQAGGPRYGAETLVEATYTITVKSWLKLQPDFQHMFDPGARRGARDAAVLGLRTNLIF